MPKPFRLYPALLPLSWIYGGIMQIRNQFYDCGILRTHPTPLPTISVGNLAVGGTGKTPMCAFLLAKLKERGLRPAFLSLGYGRKKHACGHQSYGYGHQSHGYVEATSTSTARDIGDEPLEIHQAFPDIPIAVCGKRFLAAERIKKAHPEIDCFVLDDAYQHRATHRDINILLTDYNRLYTRDLVLPAGRLREGKSGTRRAQIIIVSKCPHALTMEEAEAVRWELKPEPLQSVFFTAISYLPLEIDNLGGKRVLMLTGIANPAPLIEHYSPLCASLQTLCYPDHHDFSHYDIDTIAAQAQKADIIITTGKDFARLPQTLPKEITDKIRVQRIGVTFLFGKEKQFIDTVCGQI